MLTSRWLRRTLSSGYRLRSLRVLSRRAQSSQYLIESPYSPINIPSVTVPEKVFQNLDKWPEHTALECCMSGRSYTYSQLEEFSKRVAAGFLKAGFKQGQVIALVLPNLPEFIIATLGALRAGLVVSTINPIYAPHEIAYQLSNSGAVMALTFLLKLEEVQKAVSKIEGPKPIISVIHQPGDDLPDGVRSFMELLMVEDEEMDAVDKVKAKADDLAFLLYSSGTTGLPKGVRLTHRNIVSNICQCDHPDVTLKQETTESYQDVAACVLPFFHVYGLTVGGLLYLISGAKLVTLPRFEPEMYLTALKDHKTTIANVVPPLVQFLANHPSVTPEHLATVRAFINGAAAISLTDAHKLLEKKKVKITGGYGLTESSPVITGCRKTCENLTTVGCVVSNTQVKLLDTETGAPVEPGKSGEICAKGPQIMAGYHKNEEATKTTIIDGWLHTGDVGYFDGEGQLFIVDRIKELIKVKGFQVAPLELEELLRTHPGVADCGVVGRPNERFGELPVAFVVPSPASKPSVKDLQEFVAKKVAEYKQISEVIFVDTIPKNLTGKILRKDLKEMLTKG